ncbi:MAG: tRNA (adenosine(37)-N6)-threonylcarbamoyltransferase complex dimerization subunit type 1 TsaB, partial [Pseudomonadota bacterium]
MILGLDTSAGQCAVALTAGGARLAGAVERLDRGHAERLFPLIERALAEAGVGIEAVRRVAVCTGPGSFTGLRVGVAAARGLALGRGIPAIGITRFEAVASAVARPSIAAGRQGPTPVPPTPAPPVPSLVPPPDPPPDPPP